MRAFATTSSLRSSTDDPPACSERDPHVPAPRRTTPVSLCTTRTDVNGTPSTDGRDLGERGLVSLAVRRRAGVHRDRAVGRHLDRAEFLAHERRDLHVRREPDPQLHVIAARSARRLLGTERVHAGDPQRLVERLGVVADVVHRARSRLVRERVGGDQVLAANLHRVHAEFGGHQVHRALDQARRPRAGRRRDRARPGVAFVTIDRPRHAISRIVYTPPSISWVVVGRNAPIG